MYISYYVSTVIVSKVSVFQIFHLFQNSFELFVTFQYFYYFYSTFTALARLDISLCPVSVYSPQGFCWSYLGHTYSNLLSRGKLPLSSSIFVRSSPKNFSVASHNEYFGYMLPSRQISSNVLWTIRHYVVSIGRWKKQTVLCYVALNCIKIIIIQMHFNCCVHITINYTA